jgi:hypothetical protein
MSFTKGRHAFVVCAHIDKKHFHNHIIFNSTSLDCTRKFKNFWHSNRAIRRISDLLCAEHGLSVIENPKPSPGRDYGTWLGDKKPLSFQAKTRLAIDAALDQRPADFDAFLKLMEASGYAVKRGKHVKLTGPDVCVKHLWAKVFGTQESVKTGTNKRERKRKGAIESCMEECFGK